MVLQQPTCPIDFDTGTLCDICNTFAPGDDRLLIGVRGDTSLTFVDVDVAAAPTRRRF